MNPPPRVFLVGMGPTAASAFDSLSRSCTVVGVLRPDSAPDDAVRKMAREACVPVHEDGSLYALSVLVAGVMPDCVVVSSYHRIVGAELLAKCPFLNVHYSPLPRYRGRANVNWAILNGEPSAAITVHRIERELDSGNVLFQQQVPIDDRTTATQLYEQLNDIQRQSLGRTVLRFLQGDRGIPQDGAQATYCCARLPDDGSIDWSRSTVSIDRLVRALTSPYPGAFTWFKGRLLRVWSASVPHDVPRYVGRVPGRVTCVERDAGWVDVLTGDGVLRLLEVQAEGCDRVQPATLVRSTKDTLGLTTAELLRRVVALETTVACLSERLERSSATDRMRPGPDAMPHPFDAAPIPSIPSPI
jgi:methionyl-tRNA formyltransferase